MSAAKFYAGGSRFDMDAGRAAYHLERVRKLLAERYREAVGADRHAEAEELALQLTALDIATDALIRGGR